MEVDKKKIRKIIESLIAGNDYRAEAVNIIDQQFIKFMINFFKQIVLAKIEEQDITMGWYKRIFLNEKLKKDEIAINSGLNMKTINNMHNTSKKSKVIEASHQHFEQLYDEIKYLIDQGDNLDINLTIKLGKASVELSIDESLIIINTIAVQRAKIRGGIWSTIGKNVEKPLMQCLCLLHGVSEDNYSLTSRSEKKDSINDDVDREVDFYLRSNGKEHKCEVKLMGKGNPESADGALARKSDVFVADKLSKQNKKQLDKERIHWVELRGSEGVNKFGKVLKNLKIPYKVPANHKELSKILDKILSD